MKANQNRTDTDRIEITKEELAKAYDNTFRGRSRGSENPGSSFHTLWLFLTTGRKLPIMKEEGL